jgi:hypothetical protein
VSEEPAARLTVIGYLSAALGWVRSLDYGLDGARASLSKAYDLAVEEHRPVDQIVSLQHDLDALGELVGDQMKDLIRKMAEVEARSRG